MTQKKLPPDPEGMNDIRADGGSRAIKAYCDATDIDARDALCDLLADLMHLCDREADTFGTFDEALRCALDHYREETKGHEA